MEYWNRLIRVRDNNPKDSEEWKRADMLLGQYNTAGGNKIEGEIESFLERNEKK